jgi:hypothetical protein
MKRPLTFGSRLMAVKQLANVNVNGPGASWQRLLPAEARESLHRARTTDQAQLAEVCAAQ